MNRAPHTIVFACVHNAGRSQMAAAFFNLVADPRKAHAVSAGTEPGPAVHPEVLVAMGELGIDLTQATPRLLTSEVAEDAAWLITMGCGESCPVIPGVSREDWPFEDPNGQQIEAVRRIRDDIRSRVLQFVTSQGLQRA